MNYALFVIVAAAIVAFTVTAEEKAAPKSPLDFKLKANDGSECDLSKLKGKVVMLVNVASKCGLTPQYQQLEAIYEKYKDQGLVVIGIPCNDFGAQEPGTDVEILKFCTDKYKVSFPMMAKIHVQGEEIAPLYKYLTESSPKPGKIEWNFAKFLVGRDGTLVDRFPAKTKPDDESVVKSIETALKAK